MLALLMIWQGVLSSGYSPGALGVSDEGIGEHGAGSHEGGAAATSLGPAAVDMEQAAERWLQGQTFYGQARVVYAGNVQVSRTGPADGIRMGGWWLRKLRFKILNAT